MSISKVDSSILLIRYLFDFGRYTIGLIHRPYQTFRDLALKKPYEQLFFIALAISIYLVLSTMAKGSLLANPFFLTKSLIKVGLAIALTYLLAALVIFLTSNFFSKQGKLSSFMLLWAFTLLPTLSWFLITTLLYAFLPPPRTLSIKGQLFSILFMTFSFACFFWKGILYYLSLRVGLHLETRQITAVSTIVLPLIFLYAILMFKLRIFGVPFI